MSERSEITWFLDTFGSRIAAAIDGTPLSVPFLAAIAMQETGYLWADLRRHTTGETEFLALCVGDTLDQSAGRSAFPRTRAHLMEAADGPAMFAVARRALERLAEASAGYRRAARNPDKFCHGFGIFQLDLQFFRDDPQYFLTEGWRDFGACLGKALAELKEGLRKRGFDRRTSLSRRELAEVAIVYNTGRYNPDLGLQQGFRNEAGEYYGELVHRYIGIADEVWASRSNAPGGPAWHRVNARSGLILRAGPDRSFERLTLLPFGSDIAVLGLAGAERDWAQVDLEGDGIADGYVFAGFLVPR